MFRYSDSENDESDAPTEPRDAQSDDDTVGSFQNDYALDLAEQLMVVQLQLETLMEQSEADSIRIESYNSIINSQCEIIRSQAQTIRSQEDTISAYKDKLK